VMEVELKDFGLSILDFRSRRRGPCFVNRKLPAGR
jgi:hypothetical protein